MHNCTTTEGPIRPYNNISTRRLVTSVKNEHTNTPSLLDHDARRRHPPQIKTSIYKSSSSNSLSYSPNKHASRPRLLLSCSKTLSSHSSHSPHNNFTTRHKILRRHSHRGRTRRHRSRYSLRPNRRPYTPTHPKNLHIGRTILQSFHRWHRKR